MTQASTQGALDGIFVVDFTRVIAGPLSTQVLADLGADVVKIEHPNGDDTRGYRPPVVGGESTFFMAYNRNKRGIVLDLAHPDGLAVAKDLVAKADVVVENFSADVMAKFGLDYNSIKVSNPKVIYVAGSAYGRTGDYRKRAGYDPVVQAESGFLSINGFPDKEPVRSGIPMIDVTTGLGLAQACLAALIHREKTGEGQYVEVGLYDTALQMCMHYGMTYLMTGETPKRYGNASPAAGPLGVFYAADGPFLMAIGGQRVWLKLCLDVLKRPDLVENPDYATGTKRVAHDAVLRKTLNDIFATKPRDQWMAEFREKKVPGGPIRTVAEATKSPEVVQRGLLVDATHATLGKIPTIRNPMRFEKTPVRAEPTAAPVLGQHTDEVMRDVLGYDAAKIAGLRAGGAIA